MKKFLFLVILVFALVPTACGLTRKTDASPDPASAENSVLPVESPSDKPNPSSPEPFEPLDFLIMKYESNDENRRLYIDVEYIDPYTYDDGSLGRKLAESIKSEMDEMIEWIRVASMEYPVAKDTLISYGLSSSLVITRNSDDFISAYVDYHIYTGGAHGNLTRTPHVYDRYGNRLDALQDILPEGLTPADAEAEVNRQMKKIIEEQGAMFYGDSVSFADLDKEPCFYLTQTDMIIYFQTYEIAPYVAGIQEFVMPAGYFPADSKAK